MVELVGGGCVINGATRSSFSLHLFLFILQLFWVFVFKVGLNLTEVYQSAVAYRVLPLTIVTVSQSSEAS